MKRLRDDFCIFLISHEKPDNRTYKVLELCRVEYPVYVVVDDKDSKVAEYKAKYGEEKVLVFSKEEYKKKCDLMCNFDYEKIVVYARNACYDFAGKLGYKYFLELDDDYTEFAFRFSGQKLVHCRHSDLDLIFTKYLEYYESDSRIKILAFLQGGDFSSLIKGKVKRKAMNVMFCSTERRVVFNGMINEDTNAYSQGNKLGDIFISFPMVYVHQKQTQTTGGLTDVYLSYGTYVKSFFSVMQNPSFVRIGVLQSPKSFRIHHDINSRYGVAKIISSRYKK